MLSSGCSQLMAHNVFHRGTGWLVGLVRRLVGYKSEKLKSDQFYSTQIKLSWYFLYDELGCPSCMSKPRNPFCFQQCSGHVPSGHIFQSPTGRTGTQCCNRQMVKSSMSSMSILKDRSQVYLGWYPQPLQVSSCITHTSFHSKRFAQRQLQHKKGSKARPWGGFHLLFQCSFLACPAADSGP